MEKRQEASKAETTLEGYQAFKWIHPSRHLGGKPIVGLIRTASL